MTGTRAATAFSVTTYNILASAYARPERYPLTPASVLAAAERHPRLVTRVAALGSDVICLQEVEADLHAALCARLHALGYASRRAPKAAGQPDGCATFVRTAALTWRLDRIIAYADGEGGAPDSGHIALLVVVEAAGRLAGIANTHLKWDPPDAEPTCRRGQRQMAALLDACAGLEPACEAWVVCGDFNALPDSPVTDTARAAGLADTFAGTDLPTCVTNGRAKRIDYLFHGPSLAAEPCPLATVGDDMPLPSSREPSDHLPLSARFSWTTQ